MPRNHIDRSIREPQWTIRIVTLAILAAGAVVVAWAMMRGEARRERLVADLEVGDTTAYVVERLGAPPYVCATGPLAHLEAQFPGGWPAAARGHALERLQAETAERWVYPVAETAGDPCTGAGLGDATEIGVGHDARVLWLVPLGRRHPLRLPEHLTPGEIPNDTVPDDA